MPYLQVRITLSDPSGQDQSLGPNRTHDAVHYLIRRLIKHLEARDSDCVYATGFETLNKYGEPCAPHFHFNCQFDSWDLKDPLRSIKDYIKKQAIRGNYHVKGNRQWSCTLVEEPADFDRWIRYPLKETPVGCFCSRLPGSNGDKKCFPNSLAAAAKEERKRSIEINLLKRAKLADKLTFKDKIFKYLQERSATLPSIPDHQWIWETILQYYCDQGKSICFKTVSGYTILYQIHIKQLTYTQCYVMRSNPE